MEKWIIVKAILHHTLGPCGNSPHGPGNWLCSSKGGLSISLILAALFKIKQQILNLSQVPAWLLKLESSHLLSTQTQQKCTATRTLQINKTWLSEGLVWWRCGFKEKCECHAGCGWLLAPKVRGHDDSAWYGVSGDSRCLLWDVFCGQRTYDEPILWTHLLYFIG